MICHIVYDRLGKPVAWVNGDYLYDLKGKLLAFIDLDTYDLFCSVIVTLKGDAVGIFTGTEGFEATKPLKRAPKAPKFQAKPSYQLKITGKAPKARKFTKKWSRTSWKRFIS